MSFGNIFRSDLFGVAKITNYLNLIETPTAEMRKWFDWNEDNSILPSVAVDQERGLIYVLDSVGDSEPLPVARVGERGSYQIEIPRFGERETLMNRSLLGVRQTGSDELIVIEAERNKKLNLIEQRVGLTEGWLMTKALDGKIYDGSGNLIADFYAKQERGQIVVDLDLTQSKVDVNDELVLLKQVCEYVLGETDIAATGYKLVCGFRANQFLRTNASVKAASVDVTNNLFLRTDILSFELPGGALVPVCRMRRRPIPAAETEGELTLEFDALPSDWEARRDAVLAPMRVLPFFDPLLVSQARQFDPVEILDGYRNVGHFDRTTGAYSTPELLGLGLPTRALGVRDLVGWKQGGGIKVRRTQQPLAGVQCSISADWQEADDGLVPVSAVLRGAFPDGAVGDPTGNGPSSTRLVPHGVIATLTGDALENALPKPGSGVNGASGYTVVESTLRKIPTPPGAAAKTGAVRGQKARYDYTSDADLKKPIGLGLDISYYEASLVLSYSKRQRRQEKIGYFLTNGNVAYADGKVETVSCKCEDPTVDTTTEPWMPGQNVESGAERRVGFYVWACNRSHVTAANFAADQVASDGTELWRLLGTTQAPSGGANVATYFTTPRGVATVVAVAYKGLKKIALSQRSVSVTFTVLLEDWPDVSTACAATVTAPDSILPGGMATGKVTNVEISRSGLNDYPRATVTVTCCDGSGVPGARWQEGPNPSGQPWDGVFLASPIGQPYPLSAIPGAAVSVDFHPQAQVAFIQANDFTGQPGRNDRTENDPRRLLTKCHTKVTIACAPIAGQPALRNDLALGAGAWPGPAQISFPTV